MRGKVANGIYDASTRESGADVPVLSTINDHSGNPNQLLVAIIPGNMGIPEES